LVSARAAPQRGGGWCLAPGSVTCLGGTLLFLFFSISFLVAPIRRIGYVSILDALACA